MDESELAEMSQFRRRHSALMRDLIKSADVTKIAAEAETFMEELGAFGRKLSGDEDRASAQNILDYWSASLLDKGGKRRSRQPMRLQPFEPGLVSHEHGGTHTRFEGNPFRDMAAISRGDGTRLPGREDAIREVLATLDRQAIVFVTGLPNSGRSTLVDDGVLWQIENSEQEAAVFRVVTPAPDPLAALAGSVPGVTTEIASSPQRFRAQFDLARGEKRGVLSVDNVEELFTRCKDQAAREAFASAVVALCSEDANKKRNNVILIVRDEWAEHVLALSSFAPFANTARFTPPPPTAAELQRAIELSAASVGVTFETGLVADIARELQGDVGAFSLMQFTLTQLWQATKGSRITWKAYRSIGRPFDALTRVAEATYAALGPEDQAAARELFLALTRPSLDDPGAITVRSRRASRAELKARGAANAVAAFEDAGLLHLSSRFGADDAITVIHDALMYRWERLVGWLVDERRRSERRTTLIATASLWQSSGRRQGYLITDQASLTEASRYASEASELQDLVTASEAYLKRQTMTRRAIIGLAFLFCLAVALMLSPYVEDQYYRWKTRDKVDEIVAVDDTSGGNPENLKVDPERNEALRQLAAEVEEHKIPARLDGYTITSLFLMNQSLDFALDFEGATLIRPYMQRLKGIEVTAPAKVSFSRAVIEDGRFPGSNLTEANFKHCTIRSTKTGKFGQTVFDDAILDRVDFTGCQMHGDVSFRNADLRDAKFNEVVVTGSIDFTNADLTGATFKGATIPKVDFTNANLTNTDLSESSLKLETDSFRTTWWLANWGKQRISPAAYDRRLAVKSNRYNIETLAREFELGLARALNNSVPKLPNAEISADRLAAALNDWAWHQATYGVKLTRARSIAVEAVDAFEARGKLPSPVISDTLGYIDLQLGRLQDAEKDYEFIRRDGINDATPSARYHYALVLRGLGRCEEAQELIAGIKSGAIGYIPTHEKVLIPVPSPDPCPSVTRALGQQD